MIPLPHTERPFGGLLVFGLLILLNGCSPLERTVSRSKSPEVGELATEQELKVSENGTRSLGKNWLRKNEKGLWESFCRLEL
jgi:hypothetical protein